MDPKFPKWLDRHVILDPSHQHQLEMDAAVNEFGRKLPREQAEDEAHKQYVENHRKQALQHHYDGMKAAAAAGDAESARKHHMMYTLHAKALGHDPSQPPPARVPTDKKSSVYKFKAHKGDMFAVEDRDTEKMQKSQLSGKREHLQKLYDGAVAVLEKASRLTQHAQQKENPRFAEYLTRHRASGYGHGVSDESARRSWEASNRGSHWRWPGEAMGRGGYAGEVKPSSADLKKLKRTARDQLLEKQGKPIPGGQVVYRRQEGLRVGRLLTIHGNHQAYSVADHRGNSVLMYPSDVTPFDEKNPQHLAAEAKSHEEEWNRKMRQQGYPEPGHHPERAAIDRMSLRLPPTPPAPTPEPAPKVAPKHDFIDPDDPMGTAARTSRLELSESRMTKAQYTRFPEKRCPVKGCGKKHTPPVNQRTSGPTQVCPEHAAEADKALEAEAKEVTKKGEMKAGAKHSGHCHCTAYAFCHRFGGGKCKEKP